MPRRPRSHQVEHLSVRRFEERLPSAWVSRLVVPDYGIDREVEIFTGDGAATGLKFAAQLKATDSALRADRVRLKVELIDYLLSQESAAIVARYDANANVLRWQWASRISGRLQLAPGQKTFTHRFVASDIWDDETPATIERALRARRALADFPSSSPMPVRLMIDASAANSTYAIERAVRGVIAGSRESLVAPGEEDSPAELNIRVREGFMSVDFGELAGMTFDIDTANPSKLTSAMLYAMAFLFARKRLRRHAHAAGRAILDGKHVAGDGDLASRASYAFADDALALAELAILNDLHIADTVYFPVIVASLIETGSRERDMAPVELFLSAALDAFRGEPSRTASIHYSTANALRPRHPSRALFHYNRARHLRPAYLKADYFLAEVGGTLFNSARYACAAKVYARAVVIKPDQRLQLYLGDALLRMGNVAAAQESFKLACQSDVPPIFEEALVKLELSRMLIADYGPSTPADWSRPMGDVSAGQDERSAWLDHLASVNAFDPLANFNLGVDEARRGNHVGALGHFIACATIQTHDSEAWTNATICAFRSEQLELAFVLIRLAISLAGLAAYDDLRARLLAQGSDPVLMAELDKIAIAVDAREDASPPARLTLRVLDGDLAHVLSG
jgi:tetratricopeptide (TPR) repeat protein